MARDSYRAETPFTTVLLGIPISTFTATCASALLYLVAIIVLLSTDCPLSWERASTMLAFLVVALLALIMMAAVNMAYARYRFNCLSLTLSLLYSGSAALIVFGLIMSLKDGLCKPGGLFSSANVASLAIWFTSLVGLLFQLVAHYYYG